ncbi:hypothetical protein [Gimibacter soli]|uniref:ATP-grasp domain-containing protein n=1 Tax=Gimibacter soli TaxID=3024400 RepID=A0AAE9XQM8_9PROT|nr:hypothetical protein [Gimibacter soli]WCL54581.1 hypothetical protein PH603_02265 [Gimibacter soli]
MNIDTRVEKAKTSGRAQPVWPLDHERIRLELTAIPAFEAETLDGRIVRCFGEGFHLTLSKEGEQHSQARGWVERCLFVRREILLAARIPSFDRGHILSLDVKTTEQDVPAYRVATAVPAFAEYGRNLNVWLLGQAMECLKRLSSPQDDRDISAVQDWLQHEVIDGGLLSLAGGRATTVPVLREAWRKGIPFRYLAGGTFQLGFGAQSVWIDAPSLGGDSALGARLARDKAQTADLMRRAGLPAIKGNVVRSVDAALQAAASAGWPVVVKPVDCERGEGVAINLASSDAVRVAAEDALALSPSGRILVEPMLKGVCHRLVMVDGHLLYAVKRGPKAVVGDGTSTIAELVVRANATNEQLPPWKRDTRWPHDALASQALERAGMSFDYVPQQGTRAPLRQIESTADGGLDEDVTPIIHPENLDFARRVQSLFRLSVIGIDIMTDDISIPWHISGAVVNEVNFAPVVGLAPISRHYLQHFFARLACQPGAMPVEVVFGAGGARSAALVRTRQQTLVDAGHANCMMVSASQTLLRKGTDDEPEPVPMKVTGLAARIEAALLDRSVEALVILVESAADFDVPWPLAHISAWHDSGEAWGDGVAVSRKQKSAMARLQQALCFT